MGVIGTNPIKSIQVVCSFIGKAVQRAAEKNSAEYKQKARPLN